MTEEQEELYLQPNEMDITEKLRYKEEENTYRGICKEHNWVSKGAGEKQCTICGGIINIADEIMWQHISKEPIDIKREGLIDAPIWKAHLNSMEEYASLARKQVIEEIEEWLKYLELTDKNDTIEVSQLTNFINNLKK